MHPTAFRIPNLNNPQVRRVLAGLGAEPVTDGDATDSQLDPSFGLPPQDMINALYDIFGSYPRKNVLPYANGFTLTGTTQLAANGIQRPTVPTSADAAHIITHVAGASTGEYTLFLRTDSSDRQLMRIPVHSAAMVGTAELPFKLPKPLLAAPNTTISFEIQDLSGLANDVYLTLWGFKVYRR